MKVNLKLIDIIFNNYRSTINIITINAIVYYIYIFKM